jgi:signal-transduction protein with cAMP-binding, CBS, and nucleotidyltransferase domain
MPKAFDAGNPPFDRLTPQEVETLRAALDIAYFRPGETIMNRIRLPTPRMSSSKERSKSGTEATC